MAELIYPIGVQSFENLREWGMTYVDKTGYLSQLRLQGGCYFLSRPRRFGKSLWLSMLEAFFSGRKDLFEGLKIADIEKEWKKFPVLHFDLSQCEASSPSTLRADLRALLEEYELKYGIEVTNTKATLGVRFSRLIQGIRQATGERVVVLIDEYDKGLLETIHDEKKLEANRRILRNFYSQLKSKNKDLQFVFITGVSRFKHLTIFSGLNNLDDLSLDERFASICGISEAESLHYFKEGIQTLADANGLTFDGAQQRLKQKYDGYRFTEAEEYVYNPFSLLSALDRKKLVNYWLMTGTPQVFMTYLRQSNFDILELTKEWVTAEALSSIFDKNNPIPLLFQTGYLTVRDARGNLYQMGIPNGEVHSALANDLPPVYMGINPNQVPILLLELQEKVLAGDVEGWVEVLRSMFASAPYQLMKEGEKQTVERFFHLMVYQTFIMMGIDARPELSMSGGSADLVALTPEIIYVIEFKLNRSAASALKQINDSGYAIPYLHDGRKIIKVGISFSSKTRTISGKPAIEKVD